MKPTLFLLDMPFSKGNDQWFCSHCAMLEGALQVNPHWENHINIKRIAYAKPREVLIKLLGPDKQWLPVLVQDPRTTITDPIEITNYLAKEYGGAAPHP